MTVIGIFVGGVSRRMGYSPKGLLPARDGRESVLARLVRQAGQALEQPQIVLVGNAEPYRVLGLPFLDDDPPGVGPIGALRALLEHAHAQGAPEAIALPCDLPDVTSELIARLACHAPGSVAVAARIDDIWQPLFARYAVSATLAAVEAALGQGDRSLQRVLERLDGGPVLLPLSDAEAQLLGDWDEPSDLVR